MEIIPDAIHVFKSSVQGWITNKYILLSEDTLKKNNLTFAFASILHLVELVRYEETSTLKTACGLSPNDVDFSKPINSFDKMKVGNSFKFVNHRIVAALRLFAQQTNRKDVLTTAFFIDQLATWFEYMTSRFRGMGLSKSIVYLFDTLSNIIIF